MSAFGFINNLAEGGATPWNNSRAALTPKGFALGTSVTHQSQEVRTNPKYMHTYLRIYLWNHIDIFVPDTCGRMYSLPPSPFYFSVRLLPIWLKPYVRKFPPALTIKCEREWGTCTEAPVFALVHMRLGCGV